MLSRLNHILIPVDLSQADVSAVDAAFEMAVQSGARTTLMHVVEQIETEDDASGESDPDLRSFYEQLEQRALGDLSTLAKRFLAAGLSVECKVWTGRRVTEIVQFAESGHVDLIVVRSQPMDAAHPAASLSAVGYQVSLLCHCPVLLVRSAP